MDVGTVCIPWLGGPQSALPRGSGPGLGSLRLASGTADVYPKTKAEKLHPKQYFSCQRYLRVRLGTVNQAEPGAAEFHLSQKQQTTQTGPSPFKSQERERVRLETPPDPATV